MYAWASNKPFSFNSWEDGRYWSIPGLVEEWETFVLWYNTWNMWYNWFNVWDVFARKVWLVDVFTIWVQVLVFLNSWVGRNMVGYSHIQWIGVLVPYAWVLGVPEPWELRPD